MRTRVLLKHNQSKLLLKWNVSNKVGCERRFYEISITANSSELVCVSPLFLCAALFFRRAAVGAAIAEVSDAAVVFW